MASDVDAVHDLLTTLTGSPDVAATATKDVIARAAGRRDDGVLPRADRRYLLRAATRHAIGLADAGQLDRSAADVRDLAVLDLTVRHDWVVGDAGEAAGLPAGEVRSRRFGAARLHAGSRSAQASAPSDVVDDHAAGPRTPAPADVHSFAAARLHTPGGTTDTLRPTTRVLATAVTTIGLLAALAIGTPRIAALTTASGATTVVGEQVDFEPTPAALQVSRQTVEDDDVTVATDTGDAALDTEGGDGQDG